MEPAEAGEVFDIISGFIKLPGGEVSPELTLADHGLNSMKAIAMITLLENRYSIQFNEKDLNGFFSMTPDFLAVLIKEKIESRG